MLHQIYFGTLFVRRLILLRVIVFVREEASAQAYMTATAEFVLCHLDTATQGMGLVTVRAAALQRGPAGVLDH